MKREASAAETHTRQITFGLSEHLQPRVALWEQARSRADVLHGALLLPWVFIPPITSRL